MCGIAGEISFGAEPFISELTLLKKFSEPLKYRGPDAEGYYQNSFQKAYVSFAHRRLSIIDLDSRSNQPMEDSTSVIVFNGEIYNYQELKKELQTIGIAFITNSDTEVILKGYSTWGMDKLISKLDGMFAFVLFDKKSEQGYLTRDRFGKKPLYYYFDKVLKSIVFSSDIRSFQALSAPLTINLHALGYYFAELSTPEDSTIYNEISKLKPAHYIKWENNSDANEIVYWKQNYFVKTDFKSRSEILDKVEDLLNKAVKKRLISDVGIGCFLSGGIDSSLISAFVAKNSSTTINTYSVGFKEKEFNELPFAKKVAEKYGTNHTEIIITPDDFSIIPNILAEFGEPFADSSAIPSWFVCNAVSKNEKVVLSGDGGDELFAGYYEFYHYDRVEKYNYLKLLLPILNTARKLIKNNKLEFAYQIAKDATKQPYQYLNRNGMGFTCEELMKICPEPEFYNAVNNEHKKIWEKYSSSYPNILDQILSGSIHTRLVNDYLVKVDRTSMANSLEVRSPFLDQDLSTFAASISHKEMLYKGVPKSILKDLAKKYLPTEDIYRTKMGFGIPVGRWFENELKSEFENVIMSIPHKVFDSVSIPNFFNEKQIQLPLNSDKSWVLYTFGKWYNNQH